MFPDFEWAWAAGIVDGEGCFHVNRRKDRSRRIEARLMVSQATHDGKTPQMLLRLKALLGGRINGPYKQHRNQKPQFFWWLTGANSVEIALVGMWPWLGEVKREQAIKALRAALLDKKH